MTDTTQPTFHPEWFDLLAEWQTNSLNHLNDDTTFDTPQTIEHLFGTKLFDADPELQERWWTEISDTTFNNIVNQTTPNHPTFQKRRYLTNLLNTPAATARLTQTQKTLLTNPPDPYHADSILTNPHFTRTQRIRAGTQPKPNPRTPAPEPHTYYANLPPVVLHEQINQLRTLTPLTRTEQKHILNSSRHSIAAAALSTLQPQQLGWGLRQYRNGYPKHNRTETQDRTGWLISQLTLGGWNHLIGNPQFLTTLTHPLDLHPHQEPPIRFTVEATTQWAYTWLTELAEHADRTPHTPTTITDAQLTHFRMLTEHTVSNSGLDELSQWTKKHPQLTRQHKHKITELLLNTVNPDNTNPHMTLTPIWELITKINPNYTTQQLTQHPLINKTAANSENLSKELWDITSKHLTTNEQINTLPAATVLENITPQQLRDWLTAHIPQNRQLPLKQLLSAFEPEQLTNPLPTYTATIL